MAANPIPLYGGADFLGNQLLNALPQKVTTTERHTIALGEGEASSIPGSGPLAGKDIHGLQVYDTTLCKTFVYKPYTQLIGDATYNGKFFWVEVGNENLLSIIDWDPQFGADITPTPIVVNLPYGYVHANGGAISDNKSPFNGENVRDLYTGSRFRRANATSGTDEDHQMQNHWHNSAVANSTVGGSLYFMTPWSGSTGSGQSAQTAVTVTSPVEAIGSGAGTPNLGAETRPINMSVNALIRIK